MIKSIRKCACSCSMLVHFLSNKVWHSEGDMDFIADKYYKYNRVLFRLIGEWPTLDRKDKLIRKCIVRFGIIIFIVVQASKLLATTTDLKKVIEICTFFVPTLITGVSYYSLIFNSEKVLQLFERISCDWYEVEGEEERKIIKKYADEGRLYIICCAVLFSSFVIIIILCPISSVILDIVMPLNETRPRRLLIPVEFFIDEEKYFCAILTAIYVLSIIQFVAGLAAISGLLAALQHACAMFNVVGFVKILNDVTQETLFMCMTLAIVMLGVAFLRIIQMNMSEDKIDQMMISIIYIPITLCWVYFDCYVGQKVLDHSMRVLEKTCSIPWYLASVKVQKLSFFIMIRSMKPCHIYIGRFFVCTHEFFAQLLRVSLSYATVIYSLQ